MQYAMFGIDLATYLQPGTRMYKKCNRTSLKTSLDTLYIELAYDTIYYI